MKIRFEGFGYCIDFAESYDSASYLLQKNYLGQYCGLAQIVFLKIFLIFVISLKAYFIGRQGTICIKTLYKRDYNAFHYLYESYFSKMVLFAESYVYDEEEAKDLVQDLFFYIWDHADSLLIKTSLKAYLFTSLRNRCLNALRDRKIVDSCNDKLLEAQLFAG